MAEAEDTALNQEVARRATVAYNVRDREAFLACYAEEMIVWTGPDEYVTVDHDQQWQTVEDLAARLDMTEDILEMWAVEDRVFARFMYSATHRGEVQGVPPTGKTVEFEAWQILRMRDGLIIEERGLMDRLGFYTGLGIVELPNR